MFSRVLWRKVLKRYKKILGMEANTSLPSNVKRCFFIGLGLGTGLVASAYVAKKLYEQNNSRELVFALNQVTNEIKELRVSMVQHFERTASEFSNEQVLTSVKRRYRLGNVQQEVLRENETLPQDDSSSEDDFFDLLDEEIDIEQSNESERYIIYTGWGGGWATQGDINSPSNRSTSFPCCSLLRRGKILGMVLVTDQFFC